jgi:hypothetical protein
VMKKISLSNCSNQKWTGKKSRLPFLIGLETPWKHGPWPLKSTGKMKSEPGLICELSAN